MTSQEAPEASVEESKDEPEEEPAAEEEEEEEEEEDEEEIKDPKEELEEGSSIAPFPRLVLFLRNVVFEGNPRPRCGRVTVLLDREATPDRLAPWNGRAPAGAASAPILLPRDDAAPLGRPTWRPPGEAFPRALAGEQGSVPHPLGPGL